jgi:hypothetical protein
VSLAKFEAYFRASLLQSEKSVGTRIFVGFMAASQAKLLGLTGYRSIGHQQAGCQSNRRRHRHNLDSATREKKSQRRVVCGKALVCAKTLIASDW